MHRIDGDGAYPTGRWSEGDPTIPRLPTQITAAWMDDVQEELVSIVAAAGLALIKGTAQLGAVVANLNMPQSFSAVKTFLAGMIANGNAGGPGIAAHQTHASQAAGTFANTSAGYAATFSNSSTLDAQPTTEFLNSGGGPCAKFNTPVLATMLKSSAGLDLAGMAANAHRADKLLAPEFVLRAMGIVGVAAGTPTPTAVVNVYDVALNGTTILDVTLEHNVGTDGQVCVSIGDFDTGAYGQWKVQSVSVVSSRTVLHFVLRKYDGSLQDLTATTAHFHFHVTSFI